MNLDDLLKEMKEKMQKKDLSDEYLGKNGNTTRTEIGIGEYSYGITTIPCEWVYDFLSNYKRVLKENEELKEEIREHTLLISPYYVKENFIPVQQVKEKIEELKINLVNMQGEELLIYESKIDVLEELLEGRKI